MILAIINTQELCNICKYVRIVKRFGPLRDMSVMLEFSKTIDEKMCHNLKQCFSTRKNQNVDRPTSFWWVSKFSLYIFYHKIYVHPEREREREREKENLLTRR